MNSRYEAPLAVAESVFDDLVAVERDGGGTYEWNLCVAPIVAEYYVNVELPHNAARIFGAAIVSVLKDIQIRRDSNTENVLFLAAVIASIASAEHWTLKVVNDVTDTAGDSR